MNRLAPIVLVALLALGCDDNDSPTSPMPASTSELRVAHLAPDAPLVDIWFDGEVVLSSVPYTLVSGYLTVPSGNHQIQVTPAGSATPAVIDAMVTLSPNTSYTVAATGLLSDSSLEALVLTDDRSTSSSEARVRFVHTSPDAPAVDVAVKDGGVLFSSVSFRGSQGHIGVPAGTYDLEVRVAGTSTVALAVPGVSFSNNTASTIFAIGELSMSTLAALPAMDKP